MTRHLLTVLVAVGLAGAVAAELPRVAWSPGAPYPVPVWVAMEEALDDDRVREEWFSDHALQQLDLLIESARRLRARRQEAPPLCTEEPPAEPPAAAECDVNYLSVVDYAVLNPTLEDVVDHSEVVLVGRFRDGRPGFYRGLPSTLWRVEVDRVVKWSDEHPQPDEVYVVYGPGRAEIDGFQICKNFHPDPAPLVEGQPVFVASWCEVGTSEALLLEDGTLLLSPMKEEIAVGQPDGSAHWGRQVVRWEEVLEALPERDGGSSVVSTGEEAPR